MAPSLATILVVLLVAAGYQQYAKYFENTPCHKDPSISFSKWSGEAVEARSCDLFSSTYNEARDKFRAALKPFGNIVEEISIPIATDRGEALTMDVAIFPGNTEKFGTFVHSSGMHGVEGYAGSAIQMALLQEGVLPLQDSANRPTIVFIHAINPVGMREFRRCNEHNVDLNRNSIQDFPSFLESRDPNAANYEDFRSFLSPTDDDDAVVLTRWYVNVGIWLELLPKLFEHGFVALKRSMVAGQYHHPKGIFFGGQELQPSLKKLQEFMSSRPEIFADSPSLMWVDVHTGLGPLGKDGVHYHTASPPGNGPSPLPATAADMKTHVFSAAHSVTFSVAEQDTAEAFLGYDLSKGLLTEYLAETYQGVGLFLAQEFGTLPAFLVGRGLILDNMLYQQHVQQNNAGKLNTDLSLDAYTSADGYYRSPWLGNVFYPQSTSWRSSIVKRGVVLTMQTLELGRKLAHSQGSMQKHEL
jgi:hypothetical protein